MEVLILSCGTGGGHNTAGLAVAEECNRRGHRAVFLDVYQLVGERASSFVNNGYIGLVQRAPWVFGRIYSLGEAYRKLPIRSPVYWVNGKNAHHLEAYLREHSFDAIVVTQMFAAHMLSNLRERGVSLPKTVMVSTDYTCSPFMEECHCDYCIIPAEDLREEFVSHGIDPETIRALGIPVSGAFSADRSQRAAKEALGLCPDRPYLLLSGGSMGAGVIERSVRALLPLLPTYELIVICGSNQKLCRKLQKTYGDRITVLGKTDRMADYMKASAAFITKPGGLSSAEAAVTGVPLIHIAPIPGCESRNARYFEEHGMSLAVRDPEQDLRPALEALQEKPMINAQRNYISRRAAAEICDLLEPIQDK